MKIGAIVIHSSKYSKRTKYVDSLKKFFNGTEVIFNIIEGVFCDNIINDARFKENKPLSKGQIGCSLAHMNALKTAIDMDFDYVFIFEDDVEVIVDNYITLKKWLDKLPNNYDLCLITNVGTYQGIGHDGRNHVNKRYNDIMYTSCPFGTQAYYANKQIIQLLYNTQVNALKENKIHIADGLHIHCEKEPNIFLNIVTPTNINRFFKHEGFENSIVANI